jgi:hypothetical protein
LSAHTGSPIGESLLFLSGRLRSGIHTFQQLGKAESLLLNYLDPFLTSVLYKNRSQWVRNWLTVAAHQSQTGSCAYNRNRAPLASHASYSSLVNVDAFELSLHLIERIEPLNIARVSLANEDWKCYVHPSECVRKYDLYGLGICDLRMIEKGTDRER